MKSTIVIIFETPFSSTNGFAKKFPKINNCFELCFIFFLCFCLSDMNFARRKFGALVNNGSDGLENSDEFFSCGPTTYVSRKRAEIEL